MTINIDDLTVKQLREIGAISACVGAVGPGQSYKPDPTGVGGAWELGAIYLVRTVTMIDTGRLVGVTEHELILEDAAWIADTGRFADALEKAEFGEVEPFPAGRVIVGRGALIDAVKIKKTPRSQK